MALLDDLQDAMTESPLPPENVEELYEEAKAICLQPGKRHWSRLVYALGVLEREEYWKRVCDGHPESEDPSPCAEGSVFADRHLELDYDDYSGTLDLWELMVVSRQPLSYWQSISRARAKLLRKVLKAGIEPGRSFLPWLEKARSLKLTQFQAEVTKLLGKQVWSTFVVRAPADLIENLFEPALVLALPNATTQPNLPGVAARQKKHRFRCLEVIMAEFVAGLKRQELIEAGQRVAGHDG
jgi:hypothetical protein